MAKKGGLGTKSPKNPLESVEEVFLFPLPEVVFYPRISIPLNIFEPRYIRMVRDALDLGVPIALCMPQKTRSSQNDSRYINVIAGIGEPRILHENTDGSMIIILRGVGKVILGEVVSEKPYIVCRAFRIAENEELEPGNRFKFNRLKKIMKDWALENLEDAVERNQFLKSLQSPAQLVDCLATFFVEEPGERQALLEEDDVNKKVLFLCDHIREPRAVLKKK